jgi:hypothetical protein
VSLWAWKFWVGWALGLYNSTKAISSFVDNTFLIATFIIIKIMFITKVVFSLTDNTSRVLNWGTFFKNLTTVVRIPCYNRCVFWWASFNRWA